MGKKEDLLINPIKKIYAIGGRAGNLL